MKTFRKCGISIHNHLTVPRPSVVHLIGYSSLLLWSAMTICCCGTVSAERVAEPTAVTLHQASARIIAAAQQDTFAYNWLRELCDQVGHRLAASPGMQAAVAMSERTMRQAGFDEVWTEPVTTPHWVRGAEWARCTAPLEFDMPMLGIGLSDGTGPDGIEAEVMAVRNFEELTARADEAAGKIVLFNPPWEGYGKTVQYRSSGARRAAEHGAVACLIRSVGSTSLATPHTGMMRYADDIPHIPAAALTVEDAGRLHRLTQNGVTVRAHLYMEAENRGETTCHNVIGDLKGREFPEQIFVLGGHLDCWDTGTGAHDDGAGCAITLAAVHLLDQIGLRPRRTLRVVHFTSEEFGGYGGRAYLEAHRHELDNHIGALESDSGCFPPTGFSVAVADSLAETVLARVQALTPALAELEANDIRRGGSGVDVGPIVREGVIGFGLRVHNPDYFAYHHAPSDTFDKIDLDTLRRNVAAVALLIYAIAESPEPLGIPGDQ